MAEILLTIQHDNVVFSPPVKEDIQIEWERTGTPGKLTFTTVDLESNKFTEGDAVCFYYGETKMFMGYVFTKSRSRDNTIKVTCYDQLRYLKNKFSYVFQNKTASEIIRSMCNDFNLNIGTIENTNYVLKSVAEENTAVIDIILNALQDTLVNNGEMFVIYDDFGKITVKNTLNMLSNVLICDETAEDFDYSSSIDSDVYNEIVLVYKEENNVLTPYTASSKENISKWGTLRYFETIQNKTNAQTKANQLLRLYNKKKRELKIKGAFGSPTVRGGTLIPVRLNLGDVQTNHYMLVDKVTHKFNLDHYTMDLTVSGDWGD